MAGRERSWLRAADGAAGLTVPPLVRLRRAPDTATPFGPGSRQRARSAPARARRRRAPAPRSTRQRTRPALDGAAHPPPRSTGQRTRPALDAGLVPSAGSSPSGRETRRRAQTRESARTRCAHVDSPGASPGDGGFRGEGLVCAGVVRLIRPDRVHAVRPPTTAKAQSPRRSQRGRVESGSARETPSGQDPIAPYRSMGRVLMRRAATHGGRVRAARITTHGDVPRAGSCASRSGASGPELPHHEAPAAVELVTTPAKIATITANSVSFRDCWTASPAQSSAVTSRARAFAAFSSGLPTTSFR